MSLSDHLQIPSANADGSFAPPVAVDAEEKLREATARYDALREQLDAVNELLAKPLDQILAERDQANKAAAAWDAFGAKWMLAQRAMKRVALDLAAAQGVTEEEVVARALVHANAVLNGDGENLGGTIADAQLEHIARHRSLLRQQFRVP